MADNYSLKYTIPWVVKLYPIWKPIYEKENDSYILKYIEFLVFIYGIIDSDGKEVSPSNISYLEIVKDNNTIKIPEVKLNDSSNGDGYKNFKMNDVSSKSYDAGATKLNEYLNKKKSCPKDNYFLYGSFIDKIYGTNSDISYNEYETNADNKNYNAFDNGILFKIHLKGSLGTYCNFSFDKVNSKKYVRKDNISSLNSLSKETIVYGIASNPFFLPSGLFDDRSNDKDIYSFFNCDENNLTECFVCSREVNEHVSDEYKMAHDEGFNCFYKNSNYLKNRNYVYAVKNLYNNANIRLSLCSPIEWSDGEDNDDKFNIYQRYKDVLNMNPYVDDLIKFSEINNPKQYYNNFNLMSDEAKQLICYHNYVEDNDSTNTKVMDEKSDYDVSYNIKDTFSSLIEKNTFKKRFCKNEDDYIPNKYLDCAIRKSEINFGTMTWENNKFNSLCEIIYYYPIDYNNPKEIKKVFNNKWFFGDISDLLRPCLLFYGMYKVESVL